MADYTLTKEANRATGELPDKVTLIIPRNTAFYLINQLLLQLQQGQHTEIVKVEILGRLEEK